jgi:glyoxalase family protein
MSVQGVHHITAFSGDPQENVDFYSGLLGLRMVKVTVNFDDPGMYHLYYADALGTPGTGLTFFPVGAAPKGRRGYNEVVRITLAIPEGSLEFWKNRLSAAGREVQEEGTSLLVLDPDEIEISLEEGPMFPGWKRWDKSSIAPEYAIHGVRSTRFNSARPSSTEHALTQLLGYKKIAAEGEYDVFEAADGYNQIFLLRERGDDPGSFGAGSIHHIAFRVESEQEQAAARTAVQEFGLYPTEVRNRQYFKSIYFREGGGILFEIATNGPGFAIDEPEEALGESLCIPPQYESLRPRLVNALLPIQNGDVKLP